MVKNCDICNAKLEFVKFRYRSGYVCKACYEAASRNCRETIRELSLDEIKKRCDLHSQSFKSFHDFEVTARIGNFLLIDEKSQKFCILNNRMYTKEYKQPQTYFLKDVRGFRLRCTPDLSLEEITEGNFNKNEKVLSLGIAIYLHSDASPLNISILQTPARVKSFAFKRSNEFLKKIIRYLDNNGISCLTT